MKFKSGVNLRNWIILFVRSIIFTGITVAAGQASIFHSLFPDGHGRQLSKFWRLLENELMTAAAFLSVFLSVCLSSEKSGQQHRFDWQLQRQLKSDSTPQISNFSFFVIFSLLSLCDSLCLAVNQQMFSIPSPSLTAWLFHYLHISIIVLSACGCGCSSAHRQGLSVWLCGSSHGSFLLQPAN